MKILEEEAISYAEAKEIMEAVEKETQEMGYEQKITLDFLRSCVILNAESARKAKEELKKEIPELKDTHIAMILNILPEEEEDVKIIFAKERVELDETKIKKILEIVAKIKPEERITYKPFGAAARKDEAVSEGELSEDKTEENETT